jgi:dodecin
MTPASPALSGVCYVWATLFSPRSCLSFQDKFKFSKENTMSIMKVIEVMADSTKSWEDAAREGVERASKSVDNIASAWVKDQSVSIEDGKVKKYRVTLKVSFEVK